ncbi:CubicO group peptidase, beta-lactamase class C family [Sphingomonas palmae]|uniref:CubicO group peptidase, beta-lactamase class C family n=1 Tax=Sphingomonas palmae TaxID=1855283 RepID=A0A1H7GDJ3_9SPHN|nr:serine hydrolase [Sphingomonas palmae]SEK36104.1 CubicO group peptidase, beta-lactamase class C family [Sphingomonas palmae]
MNDAMLNRRATSTLFPVLLATVLTSGPAPAQAPSPQRADERYARAIAAGYKAATLCGGVFNTGRSQAAVEALELRGIYPEYDALVPTLTATVDRSTARVTVPFAPDIPARQATWQRGRGCTLAPIGAVTPPIATTYTRAPAPASADPRQWPMGDAGISPAPSPALAGVVARAFSDYGRGSQTVGVVVLRDGKVIAERYRDGFGPFVANRTWSVAKSISGTLVGMTGVDPRQPANIPEWRSGDPRRAIKLDDLLRMASGLHSDTAGNRTDAIYFGGTTVTEQAPSWPLEAKPGSRFRYANNDILLAVRSLRASLGEAAYDRLPQQLFTTLGMTHTVAQRDWQGNYILSSDVWSTARDLARLGQFWLQDGVWAGKRVLPAGWLRYMTAPSGPQPERAEGYGATMWLFGTKQSLPAGSYAAQGNRGQYVMVIPAEKLVVVRRGEDPAGSSFDIARFTADVLAAQR